ncbi:AI-2E family transporter [Stieleria varia]|uniref:AI-2 transport protein TqsA n=1 Tax=Stieleria varia TaxID=2528005 RepID=A0A5C6B9W9_9BACT|nr:AI-2E family transporter [Stieleria varia]TWU08517.1 AI-2 transport protein TqsA [Stieleria varia]
MTDTEPNDETGSDGSRPAGVIAVRVCAVMLTLYALYYARNMVVPVVTSLVLYMVLRPVVRQAKRFGIHPAIGSGGIILCVLIILGVAGYLVAEPAQQMIADAPRNVSVVKEKLSFLTDKLKAVDEAKEELSDSSDGGDDSTSATNAEEPVPVEIEQPEWTGNFVYLSGTGNAVSFVSICLALLYFLLATGDDLLRSIMHALPGFTARRRLIEVIANVQEGLGNYLAKITAINACLGVSVGLAMWLLGMPSPILWGAMAFAFNFIPIVGAICGAMIIFVVALVNFGQPYYAFIVTGTFLTLTSLEGQFITPSILGRSMSMSPVVVFLSIVLWGWMWGFMGVFLSVPILIAARMACEGYEGLQPLAYVLGAEVPNVEDPDTDEPIADESIDSHHRHDIIASPHLDSAKGNEATCPT